MQLVTFCLITMTRRRKTLRVALAAAKRKQRSLISFLLSRSPKLKTTMMMARALIRLSAFFAVVATVDATLEKGIIEVEEVG